MSFLRSPVDGRTSLQLFTRRFSRSITCGRLVIREVSAAFPSAISPELSRRWANLGVHSFCLNRCPRCEVALTIGFEDLKTLDGFLQV